MSKIIKDLLWLSVAGVAGYAAWRIYQGFTKTAAAVGSAATATATSAAAWTPAALGASVATDLANAGNAIADFFSPTSASPTINPAPNDFYYNAFMQNGTVASELPGTSALTAWGNTTTTNFLPGGGSGGVGSGAGGTW